MKQNVITILFVFVILFSTSISEAAQSYHFGHDKEIEVSITPEMPEYIAGSVATFTISLKNRTSKGINLYFPTGRQWDMMVYHGNKPVFRWSNGSTWEESANNLYLRPNEVLTKKLTWVAVNKVGQPLLQGDYKCVGIITSQPKSFVSKECRFKLTPPSVVAKETIKAKLNQIFEIEVPRFAKGQELVWKVTYKFNDNRISAVKKLVKKDSFVLMFKPQRFGHVEFDLFAYPESLNQTLSLERRSYRIEVIE